GPAGAGRRAVQAGHAVAVGRAAAAAVDRALDGAGAGDADQVAGAVGGQLAGIAEAAVGRRRLAVPALDQLAAAGGERGQDRGRRDERDRSHRASFRSSTIHEPTGSARASHRTRIRFYRLLFARSDGTNPAPACWTRWPRTSST